MLRRHSSIALLWKDRAPSISDTFARTALDGTMLIVAPPAGFETYDLSSAKDMDP